MGHNDSYLKQRGAGNAAVCISVDQPNNTDKLLGICSSTQEMNNVYMQEPDTRSLHHLRLVVLLLAGPGPGPGPATWWCQSASSLAID